MVHSGTFYSGNSTLIGSLNRTETLLDNLLPGRRRGLTFAIISAEFNANAFGTLFTIVIITATPLIHTMIRSIATRA